jgi:diacylglycerol kinase (ATP)
VASLATTGTASPRTARQPVQAPSRKPPASCDPDAHPAASSVPVHDEGEQMTSGPAPGRPARESSHKSRPGLVRIWRALLYSIAGLRAAWRGESAFRQEVALAALLVPVAVLLPASLTQTALLIACVMLVLVTELLNSAIESTVDRISLEDHDLAKRAKDIGSAAVLLALVNLGLVWGLVLAEVLRGG